MVEIGDFCMKDLEADTSPEERVAQLVVMVPGVGKVRVTGKQGLTCSEGPGQTRATQTWEYVCSGEVVV